ncbi:histone deacetylase complex subunit SAP130-B [Trichogramma pretiosum]|uniref:histone deacetylase complex subunit SAP130-B n=1 Tax=Trichogramma pretiosum TaxID=7493 RepID=UPI0006C9BD14|nr:histone deacetylase complex subunit SAP130-B [Trichogramma pretiosum]
MSSANSANNASKEAASSEKPQETGGNVQTIAQNLTAMTVHSLQSVQGTVSAGGIVGKTLSLDLNNSKLLMKPANNVVGSSSDSKITSTFCPVPGQTVRIIAPTMINVERQAQTQLQQGGQTTQQIVTSIPSTFHVPRGPAAVANISTPRATVATPLRTLSQPISISRPGTVKLTPFQGYPARISAVDFSKPKIVNVDRTNTTVSNTVQWQPKGSVVYAAPQRTDTGPRHTVPVVSRQGTRPAVFTAIAQQTSQPQAQSMTPQIQTQPTPSQPRLINQTQVSMGGPIQRTVVTSIPTKLVTPVLQPTRLPTPPTRPPTPQVITNVSAPTRNIQTNQVGRTAGGSTINRIAVATSVIGAPNRVVVTTVQTNVPRQLTINTAPGTTSSVSRIFVPQASQQTQQQPQSQQQSGTRIVQAVAPLANFSQVSRVIATTSTSVGAPGNVTRVAQTGPASVARITGMSLHQMPLAPTRTPLKVTTQGGTQTLQTVQLKTANVAMQPQTQVQVQVSQQSQPQQQHQSAMGSRSMGGSSGVVVTTVAQTGQQQQSGQTQYVQSSPHPTTYFSIEPSGAYSPYRQSSVQPVRLVVDQGYEEPLTKTNASPRPSILRKRDIDTSLAPKGAAKNLVPVLASLPSASNAPSPPSSPKCDRDNGNQSTGSTTESATSSPGPDDEPERSRIIINPQVEMSPRKKPRKQQLAGVELTESRCHVEDMQFITEEKIHRKEVKEEPREKQAEKRSNSHLDSKTPQTPTSKPKYTRISMLEGVAWKDKWGKRFNHFKRHSDVRAKEEKKPTVSDIAQQKQVLQRVHGWKLYHLKTQMEEMAEVEKSVFDKLKATLAVLESQQTKGKKDDGLEKAMELIKGNTQRSNLINEGLSDARKQLTTILGHKDNVAELLQRCGNKRPQKKRDNK